MEHHFNIEVAKEYGVDVAIFLQNIAFWSLKNVANKSHFKDGRYWIYNTQEAWTILFPYWSRQSVRTITSKCADKGLILRGNYNEKNYDKTIWYSMSDKCLTMFPILKSAIEATHPSLGCNQPTLGWNQPRLVDNPDLSTDPWLKSTNGLVGINQAIPDSKPDNKHKSFCEDQKINSNIKSKSAWQEENAKVHDFAESKNQMARETAHIEKHEVIKRAPMPDNLRALIKNIKRGGSHDTNKEGRRMQKNIV